MWTVKWLNNMIKNYLEKNILHNNTDKKFWKLKNQKFQPKMKENSTKNGMKIQQMWYQKQFQTQLGCTHIQGELSIMNKHKK